MTEQRLTAPAAVRGLGRIRVLGITRDAALTSAAAVIVTVAALLRFWDLGQTAINPFYAGAVRSMGMSWHAFAVGAIDPGAQVSIDKAPADLWLQVLSTKLLGFTPVALLLPEAIAGTLTVVVLMRFVRTVTASRGAALLAGAAYAVLPIAVITARSHTMDSLMALLVTSAFAVAAGGMREGRRSRIVLAGALIGVAFEAKLFEALVAAPPLALMWWLGAPGSARRRGGDLAAAAGAAAAVGLAWLVALTLLVPAAQRPWAFGSTDGSAWNSTFFYDGWARITGSAVTGAAGAGGHLRVPQGPGPLRLLASRAHLDVRIGIELVLALLCAGGAVAAGALRQPRPQRAAFLGIGSWLLLGTVLFSAQHDLRPRYLEAFTPAVAAMIGLGSAVVLPRVGRGARRLFGGVVAAVLVVALAVSVSAASAHVQVSGTPGALPPARLAALGDYLRARQQGARYEAAFSSVSQAAGLVAADGRPVLMLEALGHELVTPAALAHRVAAGEVRVAVVGRSRSPVAAWVRAHGRDVGAAAGQRPGSVYVLSAGTR